MLSLHVYMLWAQANRLNGTKNILTYLIMDDTTGTVSNNYGS